MNWEIPNVIVTSITGWRDIDQAYRIEFDGSPANQLSFDYFNEWEQFSQELRLSSNFEGDIEFIVGAY